MSRVFSRVLVAAALVATLPAVAIAQADVASPEGTTWHLTSSADGVTLPFDAGATLLLEDGTASGSTGCNTFSGSYALDGTSLVFDEQFALTRAACPTEALADVETTYLAALPQVASWSMDDEGLKLADADGSAILAYEVPVMAMTRSAMAEMIEMVEMIADQDARIAELQSQVDRHEERIDSIRIGTLRDRIRTLEQELATLKRAATAAPSSSAGSGYNAKEKVLLKAVPQKVEKTCTPLRSNLPRGTVAAVSCGGFANNVAKQAYYLMEWSDAVATMRSVATANGATKRRVGCATGKPAWTNIGPGVGAEACWIDGGKANYRLITRAAGCQQLDVAGTRLTEPALYLALEAKNNRIGTLRSAGLAPTDSNYFIGNFDAVEYIPAGSQPETPGCKAHQDWVG